MRGSVTAADSPASRARIPCLARKRGGTPRNLLPEGKGERWSPRIPILHRQKMVGVVVLGHAVHSASHKRRIVELPGGGPDGLYLVGRHPSRSDGQSTALL